MDSAYLTFTFEVEYMPEYWILNKNQYYNDRTPNPLIKHGAHKRKGMNITQENVMMRSGEYTNLTQKEVMRSGEYKLG